MPRRPSGLWAVCTVALASCAHVDSNQSASALRPAGDPADHFRVAAEGSDAASAAGAASVPASFSGCRVKSDATSLRQVAFQEGESPLGGGAEDADPAAPPAPTPAPTPEPADPGSETDGGSSNAASPGSAATAGLPPAPAAGGYTLEQLEGLAASNNPTLGQASASVGKARGLHTQVGLYPNPTVGYQANEVGNEGQAGQQGAFVSQTIVTGDKLDLNRAVTSWEIQNTQWEAEAQRFRVRNGVRRQFYQALGAQRRVEIARRLVTVAEQGLTAAEELENAGQVGRPDVLQARIQLNEVRIALRNAEIEAEASWRQLVALVGCPQLPRGPLAGDLTAGPSSADLDTLVAEVCAASPELQAARARIARARAQIRRQEAQPIPNVEAQVGGAHDFSTGDPIANLQFGLPIPVFNKNQGNIAVAQAEYRRAVADLRRMELDLTSRAAVALQQSTQAQNQERVYREEILPAAEENLRLTEAGYERGELDLLRALTARRSFFEANLALVSSQVAARQADVALTGMLLSDGLSAPPDSTAGTLVDQSLRDLATGNQQ